MAPTLLQWLAERFPNTKRQTLRRMAEAGRILLNGSPQHKLNCLVEPSDVVSVLDRAPIPAGRAPRSGGGQELDIIHEDEDVLVVNKPAGLLTSTVPREKRATLLAMVRDHVRHTAPRAPVGLIHRLDRDASGLLIFSKNDAAYRSLKTQFFHHQVSRVYTAVVPGIPDPPTGRIESNLIERADGKVRSTREHGKGQRAVTDYETLRTGNRAALLKVTLKTGRKHQIRAHLSERGWPIVGDVMYGGIKPSGAGLMLIATSLAIAHPRTHERLTFELPMPKEFADWLEVKLP